jgi:transposase
MNSSTLAAPSVFVPRDYDLFAGLDVDKKNIAVTFRDHQTWIKSFRIPYTESAEHLLNYTRKHFPDQKVAFAYEAGPTGYGLYDELQAQGQTCLVVAPAMVPRAPGQRVKTNRLDSRQLCDGLRGGQLKSIHVPSTPYRQLRHLVQLRDTFVRQVTAAKCRIKALLLFEGIPFPEASPNSQWSRKVLQQLAGLECSAPVRFKLHSVMAHLEFAKLQASGTQREIRRFCQQDPELRQSIQYLTSLPGVGWIVASHVVARLGDRRLIHNVRQIAAFVGLVSTEHSTGERVDRGSITRQGDARLRNKLIQAAWRAIRRDPELREFFRRICQRHPKDRGSRKAIVAVARKLTTRIYAVLKEQRPYRLRPEIPSAPLTPEETVTPGDASMPLRTPGAVSAPADSFLETETPGPSVRPREGRISTQCDGSTVPRIAGSLSGPQRAGKKRTRRSDP